LNPFSFCPLHARSGVVVSGEAIIFKGDNGATLLLNLKNCQAESSNMPLHHITFHALINPSSSL
jgi:hypothetical protein